MNNMQHFFERASSGANGVCYSQYFAVILNCTHLTVLWPLDTSKPGWLAPPVKNWRILLQQSFNSCMLLLTAASVFVVGRRHDSSP